MRPVKAIPNFFAIGEVMRLAYILIAVLYKLSGVCRIRMTYVKQLWSNICLCEQRVVFAAIIAIIDSSWV